MQLVICPEVHSVVHYPHLVRKAQGQKKPKQKTKTKTKKRNIWFHRPLSTTTADDHFVTIL